MKWTGLVFALGLATAAQAEEATGLWQTEAGESGGYLHVEIAPCGTALCGVIAKAFAAGGSASQGYEHLGKKMLWDMQPEGAGKYGSGKIWAPDKNKTYKSKMRLEGNVLTVKGCVAGGAICRGQNWTRVK
ncbi:DUF2147 domain-containing protein [Cognatishimia sp. SS12]|uniref:DUF2147 domain-containing protein n=1 Tax=Cognatishimia sp. SS12 TaxID=2979465 RepID=UPI00232E740F|nr:DUF2147 domain-containing protein [Cognatishimia sp. SS12]MDC0738824.1 DUF2147 domain-containing protein [Cognatishimia sp. SS12]